MPLISVVVPVYRVQAYLRECLDSILDQPYTDLEMVAVDDRSPDGSGAILDQYAARDPRVRVLHLAQNVGLGRARNAGLAEATGEYVWFVDSDDWIAPGCLAPIAARLRETRPDVLMVDYARTYWNRKARRNTLGRVYHESAAPPVFTLAEHPELVKVFPSAWNKLVRRDLIGRWELDFPPGWYEDLPFTYPLLATAGRISTLDRVCYHYRQRRHGTILLTGGSRHFELFEQYERVFERLDRLAVPDPLRALVFERMVWHCLIVLGRPDRIPAGARAHFFHQLAQWYQRYRPAGGYPPPTDRIEALRHRLVARDAWTLFRGLRVVRKAGKRVTAAGRRRLGRVRRFARRAALGLRRRALRAYYRVQVRRPLDARLAVYSSYWGRGYNCNPAAIYEAARELVPEVRGVWVVNRQRVAELPPGVPYVVDGTARYYRALARARWTFNNVNFPDDIVKRPGSIHVQTHHGTSLKKMGIDQQDYRLVARGQNFANLLRRCDRWDYSIAANPYSTEVWERAYPCAYESLEYGYPRNDRLVTATPAEVAALRAGLGIPDGATAVLYAPTHREFHTGFQPFLTPDQVLAAAGPDAVVLIRAHHSYAAGDDLAGERVRDVGAHPDINDLYLAADILITDYSSVMFDYGVLDRPIVIYAPDWDAYRLTRGVYFDLLAEPPGATATTPAELVEVFASGAVRGEAATKARAAFRERYCALEDGQAARRVVGKVFLGQHPDPVATRG